MNWADWTIFAIFGISILISVIRGFVREALSLLIWLVAFVVAMLFHQQLAIYLVDYIDVPSLRAISAWAMLFLAVLMAGSLLSFLLGQLVESTGLTGTDRFFGALFGGLRAFLLVMVIVIFLPAILPVTEDLWWRESTLLPYFIACEDGVREAASGLLELIKSLF